VTEDPASASRIETSSAPTGWIAFCCTGWPTRSSGFCCQPVTDAWRRALDCC